MSQGERTYAVGAAVPRRGNAATRVLGRSLMRLWHWQIEGRFPDVPKAVLVVAPHTSNWDFLVCMLGMFTLGLRINWLGKHTLFRWPLRPLMLWLGGIPVWRNSRSGTVARLVETFEQRETLLLAVAPEGTRQAVTEWRMGFAHVAAGAGVPVVPIGLDWSRRELMLGPAVALSGDIDAAVSDLRAWFPPVPGATGA
jgi:1-acyl-sn-glycerol-3-phosphate acyltransferase